MIYVLIRYREAIPQIVNIQYSIRIGSGLGLHARNLLLQHRSGRLEQFIDILITVNDR